MRKIMFNDEVLLTKAVLEGRKTQTRRFVPKEFFTLQWDVRDDTLVVENEFGEFVDIRNTKYCMFKIGGIVAIAQNYETIQKSLPYSERSKFYSDVMKAHFPNSATHKDYYEIAGWHNKMFVRAELMPHQIRITKVRIEKLQDISWEDCLAEGLIADIDPMNPICNIFSFEGANQWYFHPSEAYASLIDKVGKKGDWDKNPYVFVYDFELVK